MNFLDTAVLATICFRLRSSGLRALLALLLEAGLVDGAGGTLEPEGAVRSTEATCALMCDRVSRCCLRLSRYSRGVRMGQACVEWDRQRDKSGE